mmetsp:Transcript_6573/g.14555  ORF Transcript_6573/g.14555 Transcript_6573/m.14555 type:complete len:330 (+) Transcript_6573:5127-6116(+)
MVYKTLLRFGMPSSKPMCHDPKYDLSFEAFREHAKLRRKTADMLADYAKLLIQDAVIMRMKGDDAPIKESEVLNSGGTARKMMERITLMRELRANVLSHNEEELMSLVQRQQKYLNSKKKTQVPDWWKPEHDVGLLRGTSLHGIGNSTATDAILADESLPFASICKPKGKSSEGGDKVEESNPDGKNYVFPSVFPLMSRIRGLVDQISRAHRNSGFFRKGRVAKPIVPTMPSNTAPVVVVDLGTPAKTASDVASEVQDLCSQKENVVKMMKPVSPLVKPAPSLTSSTSPQVKDLTDSPVQKRKPQSENQESGAKKACYGIMRYMVPKTE